MGFLRSLFGSSKHQVWQQLSREIGGRFVAGGPWHGDRVVAKVDDWTVTLDSVLIGAQRYTRMRAPYVNRDGFRFSVSRRDSALEQLVELLGVEDIEIGDPALDDYFVIRGNDEDRVKLLLEDAEIKRLIIEQPFLHFEVKDDEGWFGRHFPDGVDELYFLHFGDIEELGQLEDLYELFAATLHRLCLLGSAYEGAPDIEE